MKKGLLLGAGFSYDLGMPLGAELTEVFLDMFNISNSRLLAAALSKNEPFGKDRPINSVAIFKGFDILINYKKNRGTNYELFLSEIQTLSDKSGGNQSERDSYYFLFTVFYEIIHTIFSIYQKTSYEIMYGINKVWFANLDNILSDMESWIFTLNHDLFVEYMALDFGIPITYGDNNLIAFPISNLQMDQQITFTYTERDRLRSDNSEFFKNTKGINLIKLHGGLSELEYSDEHLICNLNLNNKSASELAQEFVSIDKMAYYYNNNKVPSGKEKVITNSEGKLDIISKTMLTGGKKYSDTNKFTKGEEKLKIFDDILRELNELTIIGYGFGDTHVNFRISNALVLNRNLNIQIVDPTSIRTPECLKQFDYDFKIKKAMCGAAQWIEYYKHKKWNSDVTNTLKKNDFLRTEIKKKVKLKLKQYLNF